MRAAARMILVGPPRVRRWDSAPSTSWSVLKLCPIRRGSVASGHRTRQTASLTIKSLRVSNIEQRLTLGKLKLPYDRIVVASIGD